MNFIREWLKWMAILACLAGALIIFTLPIILASSTGNALWMALYIPLIGFAAAWEETYWRYEDDV